MKNQKLKLDKFNQGEQVKPSDLNKIVGGLKANQSYTVIYNKSTHTQTVKIDG